MNWLSKISPKQFFIISIVYAIFAIGLGFWLSGFVFAIWGSISVIYIVAITYSYNKPPITDEKLVYFYAPFGLVIALLYNGALFSKDLAENKDQLQQISGIIPEQPTRVSAVSKSSKNKDYLVLNEVRMHCLEDDLDDCQKIYAYAGKTATAYYQDNRFGNLVYEIEVEGQKIYEFNQQLQTFKYHRYQEKRQFAWAILIYVVPTILLFMISRFVIANLPIKTKNK